MLSLGFKFLLISCFYGWSPLNAQDSNISSWQVTYEELCRTYNPGMIPCPPLPEDIFGFLHNYTNPRPITGQEIKQVMSSCTGRCGFLLVKQTFTHVRAICCSRNQYNHDDWYHVLLEFTGCFCHHRGTCAQYNVTSNHILFRNHMQKVHSAIQKSWNIDDLKWNWRDFAQFKISLSVLYSIVWMWGLTGNILVLITIFHFMNRESVTNLFIANLSFGDILVIGFALPFSASSRIVEIWLWEDWFCKIIWLVYYTSLMVSSFTMTAMAIERYLVICHPMKAKYISTPERAKMMIVIIWVSAISLSFVIFSFVTGDLSKQSSCRLVFEGVSIIILYYILVVAFIIPLIIMIIAYAKVGVSLHRSVKEAKAIRGETNNCHQDQEQLKTDNLSSRMQILYYVLVVAFIVPLIIMIVAYAKVGVSLHQGVEEAKAMSSSHEEKLKMNHLSSRIQVVKMLVVVLATFVITWLPNMLFVILLYHLKVQDKGLHFGRTVLVRDIVAILNLLTFINSCLNPVFYALYSKSFREGFSKCFSCSCQKKKKSSIQMVASVNNSDALSTSTIATRTSRTSCMTW